MSKLEFDTEIQNLINNIDYQQGHLNKNLDIALFDYNEFELVSIFQNYLVEKGFFSLMENLIYPYLNKVGLLWSKNDITPANEHFLSNIIRRLIISEIDKLSIKSKYDKSVALFLPDGELHELSLLYSNYIFKYFGWKTYYLGLNVPSDSLQDFLLNKKPDYIFTIPTNFRLLNDKYISVLDSCKCENIIIANGFIDKGDLIENSLYLSLDSPLSLRKFIIEQSK